MHVASKHVLQTPRPHTGEGEREGLSHRQFKRLICRGGGVGETKEGQTEGLRETCSPFIFVLDVILLGMHVHC
jgi:hypothetical protein